MKILTNYDVDHIHTYLTDLRDEKKGHLITKPIRECVCFRNQMMKSYVRLRLINDKPYDIDKFKKIQQFLTEQPLLTSYFESEE